MPLKEEKPADTQLFTPAGKKMEDLSDAEKWLFEMQLSEDPLRTLKKKVTHMEIPQGYSEVS